MCGATTTSRRQRVVENPDDTDQMKANRWTPRKASEYKEDFRPRKPVLPPDYVTGRPVQGRPRTDVRLPDSRVKFTNPGKVLWPMEGFTKADVIRYYDAVAAVMLPHLKDRP